MTDALHDGYALECWDVTYRLPSGATLVSGLNLRVAQGETLVLLGRSGSGKTTTLKLINRLLEPSEGEIFISGRAGSEWNPILRPAIEVRHAQHSHARRKSPAS